MRQALTRFVVAGLLVGAGAACLLAGRYERAVARADASLATLRFGDRAAVVDVGVLNRLPWMDKLARLARARGTVAEHWQGRSSVDPPDPDDPPEVAILRANALYRAARATQDRHVQAQRLDQVQQQYARVLRADPTQTDAAYNYEFVARLKGRLAKSRDAVVPVAPAQLESGDLPAGPTIHGRPGAEPSAGDTSKFKMVVPMRPDERKDVPRDAGKGPQKVRKG